MNNTFSKKNIALFCVFCIGLFTLLDTPTVFIDEFWIGEGANNLANEGKWFITSFRNSIIYNINGYPIYSLLQSFFIKIFAYNLFSLRIVSYISVFLAAIFTLKFVQNIANRKVEWYWGLLFLFNPLLWHSAHLARPEALVMLLVSLSLFVLSLDFYSYKYALLAGMIAALGLYVHIPGVCVMLAAGSISFFYLLLKTKKWNWQPLFVVAGALFSLAIYFVFINSIEELKTFLSGEIIVVANRKSGGFIKIFKAYPLAYFKYILHNLFVYLPAILLIMAVFYFNKKDIFNKIKPYLFVIITAIISLLFFAILGRPSRIYFVNTEYWLLVILLLILVTNRNKIINYSGLVVVFIWFAHVLLYINYYPKSDYGSFKEQISKIPNIQNEVVFARIQYQGIFSNNKKYLAVEDFGYLYDYTSRNDITEYLKKNEVKYLIFDDIFKNFKFNKELEAFLSTHAKPVMSIDNQTIATRTYDDVPFHWPYASIFKKKNINKVMVYKLE